MNVGEVKQFLQPFLKWKRLLFERISDVGDVYCIEDVFQLIYSFQNTDLICHPMWNFFKRIEKRIQFSVFILDIEFYSGMRMCGQLRIPVRHCIVVFVKFIRNSILAPVEVWLYVSWLIPTCLLRFVALGTIFYLLCSLAFINTEMQATKWQKSPSWSLHS